MQNRPGRLRSTVLAIGIVMAALTAPPSALAATQPAAPVAPVPPAPELPGLPSDRTIRVGLATSQTHAEITAPGGLYLVGDGEIHWETPPGQAVSLNLSGSAIQVMGLAKQFTGPVRLVPRPGPTSNYAAYKGRAYRGEIQVHVTSLERKLSVVNVVDVEEYLLGVVPAEMPVSWPLEALKAQAVASRTYALYSLGGKKYIEHGFDVSNNTSSQAYGGVQSERERSTQAVLRTRGEVVSFQGKLIPTYYFSSSGGHTENNEIVWMTGLPLAYLRGVPDFDNVKGNDNYAWRLSYTPDTFARVLTSRNYDVGQVTSVTPDTVIGASGRPQSWHIAGENRTVTLSGEQFRSVFDLKSSARQVIVKLAGLVKLNVDFGPTDRVHVIGADGAIAQRTMQGSILMGAGKTPYIAFGGATALGPEVMQEAGVEVVGGGHGHGVGMSQWGAHGLALLGKNYREILAHYYLGTKVEAR